MKAKGLLLGLFLSAVALGASAATNLIHQFTPNSNPDPRDLVLMEKWDGSAYNVVTNRDLLRQATNGIPAMIANLVATNDSRVLDLENVSSRITAGNITAGILGVAGAVTADSGIFSSGLQVNSLIVGANAQLGATYSPKIVATGVGPGLGFIGDGSGLTNISGVNLGPYAQTNETRALYFTNAGNIFTGTALVGYIVNVGSVLSGPIGNFSSLCQAPLITASGTVQGPAVVATGSGFVGNGGGITNIQVGNIVGGLAATNVIWPVAGTNIFLRTNGLMVEINGLVAPNAVETNETRAVVITNANNQFNGSTVSAASVSAGALNVSGISTLGTVVGSGFSGTFNGSHVGDGSGLTNMGTSSYVTQQPLTNNILATNVSVLGSLRGSGNLLTNLNASFLASGVAAEARIPHTLTSLNLLGQTYLGSQATYNWQMALSGSAWVLQDPLGNGGSGATFNFNDDGTFAASSGMAASQLTSGTVSWLRLPSFANLTNTAFYDGANTLSLQIQTRRARGNNGTITLDWGNQTASDAGNVLGLSWTNRTLNASDGSVAATWYDKTQLTLASNLNVAANITLGGTITGNGAGLSNVVAAGINGGTSNSVIALYNASGSLYFLSTNNLTLNTNAGAAVLASDILALPNSSSAPGSNTFYVAFGNSLGVTNHMLKTVNGLLSDYWCNGTNVYSKQIAP